MAMKLTETARVQLAQQFYSKTLWLAWGTSNTNWNDNPPAETVTATELLNEVGRRKVLQKNYVRPNATGAIETQAGNWEISTTPTKHVYLRVVYGFTDAPTSTICQFGLFDGVEPQPGQENSNYLLPAQVKTRGNLLTIENIKNIYRNNQQKEVHEIILTF